MRTIKTRKRIVAAVMAVGLGATLSACADDDDSASSSSSGCTSDSSAMGQLDNSDHKAATAANPGTRGKARTAPRTASPKDEITLAIIPSWTDGVSTAYLWKHVLEDEGYTVNIEELADAAPLYTGLANGDFDVYPSAWPEVTHKKYMDEYGDDLETLGDYYDGAVLTMAVPEYTDVDSIADLPDNADKFDDRIVGIEPGAGLTGVMKDSTIPTYCLEDFDFVTASTPAMLTELEKAIKAKEDIVVTLWRPYWANNEFPVKDLEDPEGAMGEPEPLSEVANKDFSGEFPDVAEMMSKAKLDDEQYGSLEDLVVNKYGEGKEEQAVDEWLKQNPDWLKSIGAQ